MIYRFNCSHCGEIELNIKIAELPNAKCNKCGSIDIERIYNGLVQVWNTSGRYGTSTNKGE